MMTSPEHALRCAEDFALKAFLAAMCTSRQLNAECEQPLHVASLEQKVTSLEQEKAALEAELSASHQRGD